MDYYNIPALIQENLGNWQHHVLYEETQNLPCKWPEDLASASEWDGMNLDESKNMNQELSTQLMHSFLHASSEMPSLNKIMKLYAHPSNFFKNDNTTNEWRAENYLSISK